MQTGLVFSTISRTFFFPSTLSRWIFQRIYLEFSGELKDSFAESLVLQHGPGKCVRLPQNLPLSNFGIEFLLSLHFPVLFLLPVLKLNFSRNLKKKNLSQFKSHL